MLLLINADIYYIVLTYGEHGSVIVAAGLSLAFVLVTLVAIGESRVLKATVFSRVTEIY